MTSQQQELQAILTRLDERNRDDQRVKELLAEYFRKPGDKK